MEEMMKKGGMESADLFERFQEAGGAPVQNGGTGLCWPLESLQDHDVSPSPVSA